MKTQILQLKSLGLLVEFSGKKYLVCDSWKLREVELIVPSGLTLDDYDKTWTLVSCIGFWPVV